VLILFMLCVFDLGKQNNGQFYGLAKDKCFGKAEMLNFSLPLRQVNG